VQSEIACGTATRYTMPTRIDMRMCFKFMRGTINIVTM
jgi:hypothetical protein